MVGIHKITSLPVSHTLQSELQAIADMINTEINIFGGMEEGFREHYFKIFVDEGFAKENKFKYVIN